MTHSSVVVATEVEVRNRTLRKAEEVGAGSVAFPLGGSPVGLTRHGCGRW